MPKTVVFLSKSDMPPKNDVKEFFMKPQFHSKQDSPIPMFILKIAPTETGKKCRLRHYNKAQHSA